MSEPKAFPTKKEILEQLDMILSDREYLKSASIDVLIGNESIPEMEITVKIKTFN